MCTGNCKPNNKFNIQYALMEEISLNGDLTAVFLQDNEVISDLLDEINEMKIYLQPEYVNRLIVVRKTQERV